MRALNHRDPGTPRPAPVDSDPSDRLAEVLGLLDQLADVARMSEGLFRGIEQVTGLRVGEVQLLRTVGREDVEVHEVARRLGQTDDATTATVAGLVERGLLHQDRRTAPAGAPAAGTLRLTGDGAALLEQSQGIQVRMLDTLVAELGEEGVRAFRGALQGVADVLRTVADHTGAGPPAGH